MNKQEFNDYKSLYDFAFTRIFFILIALLIASTSVYAACDTYKEAVISEDGIVTYFCVDDSTVYTSTDGETFQENNGYEYNSGGDLNVLRQEIGGEGYQIVGNDELNADRIDELNSGVLEPEESEEPAPTEGEAGEETEESDD